MSHREGTTLLLARLARSAFLTHPLVLCETSEWWLWTKSIQTAAARLKASINNSRSFFKGNFIDPCFSLHCVNSPVENCSVRFKRVPISPNGPFFLLVVSQTNTPSRQLRVDPSVIIDGLA